MTRTACVAVNTLRLQSCRCVKKVLALCQHVVNVWHDRRAREDRPEPVRIPRRPPMRWMPNTGCCRHGDRGIVIRRPFCAVAAQQNPVSLGILTYSVRNDLHRRLTSRSCAPSPDGERVIVVGQDLPPRYRGGPTAASYQLSRDDARKWTGLHSLPSPGSPSPRNRRAPRRRVSVGTSLM
jgi:hypothetical protein